jgi:hypothetical protein
MNRLTRGILFIATALFAVHASAAPIACAASGSFANLMATNAAGGCYVEDQLFSQFTYLSSASGLGVSPVTANNFSYSTIANAPDAVGFHFDFVLTALPNTSGNISIGWLVTGSNIVSSHLLLNATATGTAVAIAQTSVCTGGAVAGCPVGSLHQLDAYKGFIGTDLQDAEFFSPVQVLGVSTNISVVAAPGASATITGLTQTIDPPASLPEPASLAMTGGALVSLVFIRRRRP